MRTLYFSHSSAGSGLSLSRTSSRYACTYQLCCCAKLPSMGEEKQTFDEKKAALMVMELRDTFRSGKTKSYEWRVSQLKSLVKMIEEKESEILQALYKDLSKPKLEAFISEVHAVKNASNLALKELKSWMKPEKVKTNMSTYPSSAEILPEPLGVVLVISAWNYPFLLSLDPVVGAIAAGNAVVLKPSEISPATSSTIARLLAEYLDNSTIRVIEGAVPETTALLEQKWDKIFFTGGGRVGRIVMSAAARHLTPVTLELGGKNPVVVDSNVDVEVAARRIVAGKWAANCGQICIGADYIITTKKFAPKLIDVLRNKIEEFFGKDPTESSDQSRIVNSFHFRRLANLLDEVSDKIVVGGQRDESRLKIAPTILLDVPENAQIMQEEIFGPLLPIITVENLEECFGIIEAKPKPLSAYLFTNDQRLKKKFVQNVSAGGIAINDTILQVAQPNLPFGGVGESGMGCYHGKFSFDAFTHRKPVLYRIFARDSSVRYPPYTPKKEKIMRALLSGNLLRIILTLLGWSRD